jgi:hypothetical protein
MSVHVIYSYQRNLSAKAIDFANELPTNKDPLILTLCVKAIAVNCFMFAFFFMQHQ